MPHVEVPSYKQYEKLRGNKAFHALMAEAIDIRTDMEAYDERLSNIKDELDALLAEAGVEGTLDYNGWQVQVVDRPGATKLNKKKLLALLGPNGVEIMKKAMVQGAPQHFVKLVSPQEKREEGAGE